MFIWLVKCFWFNWSGQRIHALFFSWFFFRSSLVRCDAFRSWTHRCFAVAVAAAAAGFFLFRFDSFAQRISRFNKISFDAYKYANTQDPTCKRSNTTRRKGKQICIAWTRLVWPVWWFPFSLTCFFSLRSFSLSRSLRFLHTSVPRYEITWCMKQNLANDRILCNSSAAACSIGHRRRTEKKASWFPAVVTYGEKNISNWKLSFDFNAIKRVASIRNEDNGHKQ